MKLVDTMNIEHFHHYRKFCWARLRVPLGSPTIQDSEVHFNDIPHVFYTKMLNSVNISCHFKLYSMHNMRPKDISLYLSYETEITCLYLFPLTHSKNLEGRNRAYII